MKCMTDISFHNKESYMFLYKICQEKMSVIMAVTLPVITDKIHEYLIKVFVIKHFKAAIWNKYLRNFYAVGRLVVLKNCGNNARKSKC